MLHIWIEAGLNIDTDTVDIETLDKNVLQA